MLLEIFNAPLDFGAQLFLLIVCILIGTLAGLSVIDARNTKAVPEDKEKKK